MIAKNPTRNGDRVVNKIRQAFADYQVNHRRAVVEVKRQGRATIRVRVVDPDFRGLDKVERWKMVWPVIEPLPSRVRDDIYILLLLTPAEKRTSFLSKEFDDPSRSLL